jgi:hypothetical protein
MEVPHIGVRLPVAVLLALVILNGCAGTVIPPAAPRDPVTVAVVDYGRHSSIVLPVADHRMVEYAYGDWRWFALGKTNIFAGLGAMIRSPQAALGRREVHALPNTPDFARQIGVRDYFTFDAPAERVVSLLARLDTRFARGGEPHFSPYAELWMVRDDGPYHLFHNSNHFTASSMKALGADVRGLRILSHFRLRGD